MSDEFLVDENGKITHVPRPIFDLFTATAIGGFSNLSQEQRLKVLLDATNAAQEIGYIPEWDDLADSLKEQVRESVEANESFIVRLSPNGLFTNRM